MLTVTVGLVLSGKSSTLRPLGRRYSVMPSTSFTFLMALTGIALPSLGAWGMGFRATLEGGVMTRWPSAPGASSAGAAPAGGGSLGCAGGLPLGGAAGVDSGGCWGGTPGGVAGGVSPVARGAGVLLVDGWPA